MTAGVFFILTIVTLIEFGPSTTATPAQLVMNFPNVRTGLAVGNGFYFLVSVSLVGLASASTGLSAERAPDPPSSEPSYTFWV